MSFVNLSQAPTKYRVGTNDKIVGKTNPDKLSHSRAWTPRSLSLVELAKHIGMGYPWMPGVLDANSRRLQSLANYAAVLAIDIDGVITIEQAMELPIVRNACGLIIESSSSTPEHHKFRLVFPLPAPLTDWQTIRLTNSHLIDILRLQSGIDSKNAIDGQCKDSSRFFFGALGRTPRLLNESAALTEQFLQDARDKEAAAIAEWEAGRVQRDIAAAKMDKSDVADRAWRALQCIPEYSPGNGTYNDLVSMSAGVINTLGSEGERLLELWGGFGAGTARKISGLVKSRPQTREATISSLFYLARQHGYTSTPEEKKAYAQSFAADRALNSVKKTKTVATPIQPIILYQTSSPDLDKADFVGACEGSSGKPTTIASKFGIPVIGAIGGNFGKGFESFYRSSGRKNILLFPDAGAIHNPDIITQYKKLADFVELQNEEGKARDDKWIDTVLMVQWWDQFKTSDADPNELGGDKSIALTWKQFFSCTLGTDRRYADTWKDSRKFTPDEVRDSRYCDFNLPKRGEMLCVKAGLGLGKTHRVIEQIISKSAEVISLNPTNSLCINFGKRAEKRGITSELIGNLESANGSHRGSIAVITLCPDSILNIKIDTMHDAVLVIDEAIETGLAFRQRKTHIKKIRRDAIEHLTALLNVCKGVVLLDGNLTDQSVQWFQDLCPSLVTHKIEYSHRSPMHYEIELGTKEEFLGNLLTTLKLQHDPVFFATDSKADTRCTQYALNADTVKESILKDGKLESSPAQLIRDDVAAFIKEFGIDGSLSISPVAGAGWDCSVGDHFKDNFLLGVGVIGVDGLLQMSARDRNTVPHRRTWVEAIGLRKYWAIDHETCLPDEMQKIYLRNQAEREAAMFAPPSRHYLIRQIALQDFIVNDPTARLVCSQVATTNFEEFNLRGCFIKAAIDAGHTVSLVQPVTDDDRKEAAIEHKIEKKLEKRVFAAETLEAVKLTDDEAETLKNTLRVAPGVLSQLNRHAVEKMLPGIAEKPIWSDVTENEKDKTIANVEFLVRAPKYAQKATEFFFLTHPKISLRKEQYQWQAALNNQYLDLTAINTKYSYTKKIREILMEIDTDFVGLFLKNDVPQSLAVNTIQAFNNISGSLVNKEQQKAIVMGLRNGSHRKNLNKKSHAEFVAAELKKFGYAVQILKKEKDLKGLDTAVLGDLWVTAPFLEAGTIESQCYECICDRFAMDPEEPAEMAWEVSEEPIAVSESLSLLDEFKTACEGMEAVYAVETDYTYICEYKAEIYA